MSPDYAERALRIEELARMYRESIITFPELKVACLVFLYGETDKETRRFVQSLFGDRNG